MENPVADDGGGSLPSDDEQRWLLDELRALIAQAGVERFVAAPLLEPTDACFPDRWRPTAGGVRTMARRLLDYAELDLDACVELYHSEHEALEIGTHGLPTSSRHQGAAAWFAGIEDYHCFFGASADGLESPEQLTGVMAHEVAHAYRRYHRLEHADRDLEERLTDLTTIYLGFGILTTNASYRYRVEGGGLGDTHMAWSHQRAGYLSPQAMSFLLAVRAVALRLDGKARREIKGHLEPNQASFFAAACATLRADELDQALELPPQTRWPAPRRAEPRPLPENPDDDPDDGGDDAEPEQVDYKFNAGAPVFRVRATAFKYGASLGVAGGLAAGAVAAMAHLGGTVIVIGLVVPPLAGAVLGRRTRADICSDPDCDAPLTAGVQTCPRCGGTIAGEIASRDDRLDAEAALEGTE